MNHRRKFLTGTLVTTGSVPPTHSLTASFRHDAYIECRVKHERGSRQLVSGYL